MFIYIECKLTFRLQVFIFTLLERITIGSSSPTLTVPLQEWFSPKPPSPVCVSIILVLGVGVF